MGGHHHQQPDPAEVETLEENPSEKKMMYVNVKKNKNDLAFS